MIFFNKKANIRNWSPSSLIKNKKVLILGNGTSINENKKVLENLIKLIEITKHQVWICMIKKRK